MGKALVLLVVACFHLTHSYDEKYDLIEMEKIVQNEALHRLVNDCILEVMDCGPYWEEVRALAPEIAKDRCAHCTPRQRVVVTTYVNSTKKAYPDAWLKIRKKFKRLI